MSIAEYSFLNLPLENNLAGPFDSLIKLQLTQGIKELDTVDMKILTQVAPYTALYTLVSITLTHDYPPKPFSSFSLLPDVEGASRADHYLKA